MVSFNKTRAENKAWVKHLPCPFTYIAGDDQSMLRLRETEARICHGSSQSPLVYKGHDGEQIAGPSPLPASWLEVPSHHTELLLVPRGAFACLDFSGFPFHQGDLLCIPLKSAQHLCVIGNGSVELKKEQWSLVKASHGSSHRVVHSTHWVVHHIAMTSPALWPFSGLLTQQRLYLLQIYPCISEIALPARSGQRTASQGIPDTRGCSVLWGLANTRILYDFAIILGIWNLLFIIFSFSFHFCFFSFLTQPVSYHASASQLASQMIACIAPRSHKTLRLFCFSLALEGKNKQAGLMVYNFICNYHFKTTLCNTN